MSAPIRIQRRRVKGWRMPANTVCVTRPGKWGNPFIVCKLNGAWRVVSTLYKDIVLSFEKPCIVATAGTKEEAASKAVELFREALILEELTVWPNDVRRLLRGKNLACFCPIGSPCHADVLLEIANGGAK